MLNIYLLSQNENNGYDTYDSCVVIAENEEEAKLIHPDGICKFNIELNIWISDYWYNKYLNNQLPWDIDHYTATDWCKYPSQVIAQYIGEFKGNLEDYPNKVICASFNAG